jgi:predicted Ser/Thr protein kinase
MTTSIRPPLAPGTSLGGYVVEQMLGRGGMGDVYLARDLAEQRLVALKVLPTDAADDPHRRERLQQEGRVLQSLRHPNICAIHEVGEDAGRTFLAMEYLEGRTLHEVAFKQRLEVDRIIEIACQLASALEAARRIGIVHRDLKGTNVMVLPSGDVKILDFGLAKVAAPSEQRLMNTARATDPGLIFGTAEYMSPEQALGRTVDHRSDLFALGVILYELLTQTLPFQGSTRMELFWSIVNKTPDDISIRNAAAPPELNKVVERLLEKDARSRYQTAEAVLSDLRAAVPHRIRRRAAFRRARQRWTRRILGSAAGILVALALLPFFQTAAFRIDDAIDRSSYFAGSVWSGASGSVQLDSAVTQVVNPVVLWIGNNGGIVYRTRPRRGEGEAWWTNGSTSPKRIATGVRSAAVDREGQQLFFATGGERPGIYRADLSGSHSGLLAEGPANHLRVAPDGQSVLFTREVPGGFSVWSVAAGGGQPYQLSPVVFSSPPIFSPDLSRAAIQQPGTAAICAMPDCVRRDEIPVAGVLGWTPDGQELVHPGPPGDTNIWAIRPSDGRVRQITRFTAETATGIVWSPDGRRMAVSRRRTLADVDWLGLIR